MISRRKKNWIGILAASALALAASGLAAHRFAAEHVRYYTGIEPESLNCVSCHYVGHGGTLADRLARPRYRSPLNLAVSADGRRLFAAASQGDALLVVDLENLRLLSEIPVGSRPNSVALSADGRRAYVSCEGADSVSVVDLESGSAVAALPAGSAPAGLAISRDGSTLFIANWFGNDLSAVDLRRGEEARRLPAGSNPYDLALTPDGQHLLVTNQLSFTSSRPSPPVSEVTVMDVEKREVAGRIQLQNAHLLEGVAVAPEGDLALITLVRPKNLLPATQVARGWMMTNGLGVVDLKTRQAVQLLLDEPNAFYADPCDVAFTPDGRLAFVSHSGADAVTVIEVARLRELLESMTAEERRTAGNHLGLSRRFVKARIPTGANPKGLAVSPDGKRVYVAERLADRIAVIDVERLQISGSIDVTATRRETVLRRGEKLFNSAARTFQGQFSCRSCHPNNHVDRLQYDFEPDGLGRNIVDNRTLLEIDRTGPFKWNGKNTSMYMQCGMRFAKFLTRVEPFSFDDLNAMVAFLRSLRNPPNSHRAKDGTLTPAQARGKALYERAAMKDGTPIPPKSRCLTCHPPPFFTNRQKADVGSISPADSSGEFDTPQLRNIYQSAPYLHDGKAATLEEIWTRFNPDDTHGVTVDFSKSDLNDLIEYLKTL
ncbi:MAG: beta-propeller fold lactonase family protein [Planctomycetes bacterium]|nr:beta-propeller fold lactonase family protein [Planctomycetota bacterium]